MIRSYILSEFLNIYLLINLRTVYFYDKLLIIQYILSYFKSNVVEKFVVPTSTRKVKNIVQPYLYSNNLFINVKYLSDKLGNSFIYMFNFMLKKQTTQNQIKRIRFFDVFNDIFIKFKTE